MQHNRSGRIRRAFIFRCHFLLSVTSVYLQLLLLAGKQMNPALHPNKLSIPISSRAYSSMCHFTEQHCAEISLRALRTLSGATALELRDSPEGVSAWVLSVLFNSARPAQLLRAGPLPFAVPLLQAKALTGLREECQVSLGSTHLSGLLGPGWKMT